MEQNFLDIYNQVKDSCIKNKKDPSSVEIVAVSKKQSVEKIQAYINFCEKNGYKAILGENYVQEWIAKKDLLKGNFECHLIGHLQSNKTKIAVNNFHQIQSVDSLKLANLIAKESTNAPYKIWIQVNVSGEQQKSGIQPNEVLKIVTEIEKSPLEIIGLMAITGDYEDQTLTKFEFDKLCKIRDNLNYHKPLKLSMGMSNDFKLAIDCGSSMVRIGSALFGKRE
jgi:pyridoxal phosphate enzyme (YggS family)